jgi:SAM-dependent methyltransferase
MTDTHDLPADTGAQVPDIGYGAQFAGFYDKLFPAGPGAEQAATFLAGLHPGGGPASLELGVGTGRIAIPLARRTGPVVGVDSSAEMLEVLRATGDPMVRPVHADIRTYADDERFGVVFCVCGTLSMLLDPADQAAVLRVAARHLAPGGVVVIETHNPAAAHQLNQGRVRDSFFVPYPGPDTGLLSFSTVDAEHRIWHLSHLWFDDGRTRIAQEISRLTDADEIDAYAASAGLRPVGRYGDWVGSPFTGAEAMVVCVYKAAGDE